MAVDHAVDFAQQPLVDCDSDAFHCKRISSGPIKKSYFVGSRTGSAQRPGPGRSGAMTMTGAQATKRKGKERGFKGRCELASGALYWKWPLAGNLNLQNA